MKSKLEFLKNYSSNNTISSYRVSIKKFLVNVYKKDFSPSELEKYAAKYINENRSVETVEQDIEEACSCPSGRLVECDKKTEKVFENEFAQSISLVEDSQNKVSSPIWLKGGVLVESSDGTTYEVRNRQTLCRCGKSQNKPFCEGAHIDAGFNEGDESLK